MVQTPLHHPQRQRQRGQFYPFTVTIKDVQYNDVAGRVNLPCAYAPATGGEPQEWETEAASGDRILLQEYTGDLEPGLRAFLNLGSTEAPEWRRFTISDVLPVAGATQTLLVVTPVP